MYEVWIRTIDGREIMTGQYRDRLTADSAVTHYLTDGGSDIVAVWIVTAA